MIKMKLLLPLISMLALAGSVQAELWVEIDDGVDLGDGLYSYGVRLVADVQDDKATAWDGSFDGPMNQVLAFGALSTPTLTNALYLSEYDRARDSHFLPYDADLLTAIVPNESANHLAGAMGFKSEITATDFLFAQIVVASGQTVTMTGRVADGSGTVYTTQATIIGGEGGFVYSPSAADEVIVVVDPPSTTDEISVVVDLPSTADEISVVVDPPSTADEISVVVDPPSVADEASVVVDPPSTADEVIVVVDPPSAVDEISVVIPEINEPIRLLPIFITDDTEFYLDGQIIDLPDDYETTTMVDPDFALVSNHAVQVWPDGYTTADMQSSSEFKIVPEPATLGLLAIGAFAMVRRRRR